MTETGSILDTYLIAQALGWEWNFTTMVILWVAPIVIIGGIIFIVFFIIPFVLDKLDGWDRLDKLDVWDRKRKR